MALDPSLAGRSFGPTAPYPVTEERVAEFAAATGASYTQDAAPPTFPIVVAFKAMTALMEHPEVGIELHRVVHGEQRFTYTRPVAVGDELTATLTVDTLRQRGGADFIGTRSEVIDGRDQPVCTAFATLVHRPEDA